MAHGYNAVTVSLFGLPSVKHVLSTEQEEIEKQLDQAAWAIVSDLCLSVVMDDTAPRAAQLDQTLLSLRYLVENAREVLEQGPAEARFAAPGMSPSLAEMVERYIGTVEKFRDAWEGPGASIAAPADIDAALRSLQDDLWEHAFQLGMYCQAAAVVQLALEQGPVKDLAGVNSRRRGAPVDGMRLQEVTISRNPEAVLVSSTLPAEIAKRLKQTASALDYDIRLSAVNRYENPGELGVERTLSALHALTEDAQQAVQAAGPAAAALDPAGRPAQFQTIRTMVQDVRAFKREWHPQVLEWRKWEQLHPHDPCGSGWPNHEAFDKQLRSLRDRLQECDKQLQRYLPADLSRSPCRRAAHAVSRFATAVIPVGRTPRVGSAATQGVVDAWRSPSGLTPMTMGPWL